MTAVLVTGSRHATVQAHGHTIRDVLAAVNARPGPHTLWHGDADGLDRIADTIARRYGWHIQAVPADWTAPCTKDCRPRGHRRRLARSNGARGTYCPAAGNYRNAKLVDGVVPYLPDVQAFAFPMADSRGTWDCIGRIKKAGIPLDIIRLAAP